MVAVGGTIACSRYNAGRSNEITITDDYPLAATPEEIYIGGAVANPGYYPLKDDDIIVSLIQAAGGSTDDSGTDAIKLYVNNTADDTAPQKVDLNRADIWLLEALPGIGAERAGAIINYRLENGRFQSIKELLNVSGIGSKTFEEIKDLITVSD